MTNALLTTLSAADVRNYYAQGFWRAETIFGLVHDRAESSPDKVAVRERFRSITYGELIDAADRLAADLDRRGLCVGQRVAVWLPSRIETAVALLACSRNGYVCCPSLHREHTVGEIAKLLARIGAAVLIAAVDYGADSGRGDIFVTASTMETVRAVFRLDPQESDRSGRPIFDEIGAIQGATPVHQDPDTIVYLAFTSGTAGRPKGVMHSDNTLLANARALAADWSLDQNMVVYSLSPLSHNLGWGAMIMTLTGGGEFILHDLPRGESLVDRLVATGTTFVFGVPTHAIDLLAELRDSCRTDISAVKGFRVSGAAVPPAVASGLLDHGIMPQSGYGMTEAGSHHYTLPDDDPRLIIETSGKACRSYDVKIFADDDMNRELPAGEVGQIGGRGASLMLGYFDDQAETERAFNAAGWFMTGDLGWVDSNGYIRVTGRKKELIIRGGRNIYPAKIENLAMRHEAVERVAVIPVADARLGERVCIAIQPRSGRSVGADELLAHLDDCKLSKFEMPEYFLQLDHIPLTPSGKILKRDLVEGVEQRRFTPMAIRYTPTTGEVG